MSDRYDLEQDILRCWAIIEDIELVRGRPELIDSLKAVYEAKFQRCFDTFSEYWKEENSKKSRAQRCCMEATGGLDFGHGSCIMDV